ncbi:MAG: energy transducer TonB [Bacteroidota bacterium]
MKNLNLLFFLILLGFQSAIAQQTDSGEVKSTKIDTIQRAVPPPPKEELIFRVVEGKIPRFPGCQSEKSRAATMMCSENRIQAFIQEEIEYPKEAKENGIEGLCLVSFRVKRDGEVTEVKLVKDIGGKCGQEALRVINLMASKTPYWIPPVGARIKVIDVKFIMPVRFELIPTERFGKTR